MHDDARTPGFSVWPTTLCDPDLAPFFWIPERRGSPSAWWGHVPFAHWIVSVLRPDVLVELGTQYGVSYAAFCNAVVRQELPTRCFAVDNWLGDSHTGAYDQRVYQEFTDFHERRYAGFSTVLRCSFDDALEHFPDGSIDLLHIDGCHTYEAVRHDFDAWRPKCSDRAVVLFHDTAVHREDFGVWRFWREISAQFPHFEFQHSHGLGVLGLGGSPPLLLNRLCALGDSAAGVQFRNRVAMIGERWVAEMREWDLRQAFVVERTELEGQLLAAQRATAAAEAHAAKLQGELAQLNLEADTRVGRARQTLASVQRELARARTSEQLAAAEAVHVQVTALRNALAEAEERLAQAERKAEAAGRLREAQLAEMGELQAVSTATQHAADEYRAAAEQQIAAARADNEELKIRLAERTADAAAAVAREAAALAEIDRQRKLIGKLSRQGQAGDGADLNGEPDRLAAFGERMAAVEREARDREAQLERAAAAKLEELSARLTESMREAAVAQQRAEQLSAELLAGSLRRQNRAGALWRVARRVRERRAGWALRAGNRASRSGNAAAAARYYRLALDRVPGLSAIWVQLGHALKEMRDYGGAEAAYRQALALDGSAADTHLQLGHLLKLSDRWAEAAQAYARAYQLDPALPHAVRELDALCARLIEAGDKARDAREWRQAAQCYRGALDSRPGLTAIWVQLGHALKEQGDCAGAEAAYRRALALDESVADTHLQLGHVLKLLGRWGDAADAYARALQLDPALNQAGEELDRLCPHLVRRADEAAEAGDWGVAAWYCGRALDRLPEDASIWLRLGRASEGRGDTEAAETAYRKVLRLDSANAQAQLRLGSVLEQRGRPSQAIDAYAAALRLAPDLAEAGQALHALLLGRQQGETEAAAASQQTDGDVSTFDAIWLGVIDWHYRIQRPQHLATNLADLGARVFYVSLTFETPDDKGRFRIVESPHRNVFEVRIRFAGYSNENLYRGLSANAVAELQLSLDELIAVLGIRAPVVVVEHPAWQPVACGVPGATVVYDCLDLATGFSTAATSTATYEAAMLATADVVVAASRPLVEHIAASRSSVLVRNAADVELFSQGFTDRPAGERPVVGYFGAIADWFNIEWIERAAAARPDWDFRLVGRTDGCGIARAERLRNVRFLGEKPYRELPLFLREVDVAVIPFKMIELIRCTNPVKLYEYMAAGKPVVAAPMPEVIELTDLAYVAEDAQSFVERIEQALAEDSTELRLRRLAWAREHTWENRARRLKEAIEAALPLVSVVILAHNNWDYTAACLASVLRDSDYLNLEIIVVDNASTDQTRDQLRQLQRQDPRLRVILTDRNLGFGGGNNVGLRAARGEFVILLNNDTVVTRGWVRDLIRPMQLDPRIGLAGPLTNSIGNEQKVKPGYGAIRDMPHWARRFVRGRLRQTFEAGNLAFFCVAMRRSLIGEIGLLDEAYGLGFFEDDDYCRRARQAGYRLVIVDDVFVHHQLSASYAKIGSQAKDELMARNRAIFEERWGPWQPHRYRDAPGFGA